MTGRIRAVLFVVAGCLATAAATIREIVGDLPVVSIAERYAVHNHSQLCTASRR